MRLHGGSELCEEHLGLHLDAQREVTEAVDSGMRDADMPVLPPIKPAQILLYVARHECASKGYNDVGGKRAALLIGHGAEHAVDRRDETAAMQISHRLSENHEVGQLGELAERGIEPAVGRIEPGNYHDPARRRDGLAKLTRTADRKVGTRSDHLYDTGRRLRAIGYGAYRLVDLHIYMNRRRASGCCREESVVDHPVGILPHRWSIDSGYVAGLLDERIEGTVLAERLRIVLVDPLHRSVG